MARNYNRGKDSFEINELAALSEDISDEFIDQLQNQLAGSANTFAKDNKDDAALFEEPAAAQNVVEPTAEKPPEEKSAAAKTEDAAQPEANKKPKDSAAKDEKANQQSKKEEKKVNINFDDNFIKKYKAKLNKKTQSDDKQDYSKKNDSAFGSDADKSKSKSKYKLNDSDAGMGLGNDIGIGGAAGGESIDDISKGDIIEKPLNSEFKEYNDSLDFLDGNVKYSKYVIYIDPQNVDFIDGLTVKERKNLINSILRQQDDISITKQRFKVIQTVIRQSIVAVLTLAIAIPIIYTVINASLELTINNHRNAQTNWQTLYREHGKISQH